MNTVFALNHRKLAADPRFSDLATGLEQFSPIESPASFNHYCRTACQLWPGQVGRTTRIFTDLLQRINSIGPDIIQTTWGGVVVTLHEHPRVEKYLVIQAGGYLALEKHDEKDEHLEIMEGAGLILHRQRVDQPLEVEFLIPGSRFHFEPGMEHCLIGTEDLLVFERSTDPKGMDRDLIFIFEPEAS